MDSARGVFDGNGVYNATYRVVWPGEYTMFVRVNGDDIDGSPFNLIVADNEAAFSAIDDEGDSTDDGTIITVVAIGIFLMLLLGAIGVFLYLKSNRSTPTQTAKPLSEAPAPVSAPAPALNVPTYYDQFGRPFDGGLYA